MSFNTEKNKLRKNWNRTTSNKNIIVTQQNDNKFIIEGIDKLNNLQSDFSVLLNVSSDWVVAETTVDLNNEIDSNGIEFKLTFDDVPEKFIPFIHGEILYRASQSGNIPLDGQSGEPFDDVIGEFIKKNEVFVINEGSVEYTISMFMEELLDTLPEIEYKMVCYLFNPNYKSDK